jgi:hypothetical protein
MKKFFKLFLQKVAFLRVGIRIIKHRGGTITVPHIVECFFIINYFYLFQSSLFFVCVIFFNKGYIYATLDEPPTPVSQNKSKNFHVLHVQTIFFYNKKEKNYKLEYPCSIKSTVESLTLF